MNGIRNHPVKQNNPHSQNKYDILSLICEILIPSIKDMKLQEGLLGNRKVASERGSGINVGNMRVE
jgi:hypothetical protein